MAIISITTFPDPIFPKRFVYEAVFQEKGILRSFKHFLHQFNLGPHKFHSAVMYEGEKEYVAFSDHAAFLYKRKGQIVQRTDGTVVIDGQQYKIAFPHKFNIYRAGELDCKMVRGKTVLVKRRKNAPR